MSLPWRTRRGGPGIGVIDSRTTQNIRKVRYADRLRSLFNGRSVGRITRISTSSASFTAATDVLPVDLVAET